MSWPAASYLQIPARLQAAAVSVEELVISVWMFEAVRLSRLTCSSQLHQLKTSLGLCAATSAGNGVFTEWQACLVSIRGRAQHCSVAP